MRVILRFIDDRLLICPVRIAGGALLKALDQQWVVLVSQAQLNNGDPLTRYRAVRPGDDRSIDLANYNEIHLPNREVLARIQKGEVSHV